MRLYSHRLGLATAKLVSAIPIANYAFHLKPGRHHHSVQFYSHDTLLIEETGALLSAALERGDSTIVIASPAHREGFSKTLKRRGLDTNFGRLKRRYFEFDAAETISQCMVKGLLDAATFSETIGHVLVRAKMAAESQQRSVFAFGEMVALLWAEGNPKAAIALERIWNDLAHTNSFALRCAYPSGAFHASSEAHLLQICAEHSHVISTDVHGKGQIIS
jgi:DcmR-like sensory protein